MVEKENEYEFYKRYAIAMEQSIYFWTASIFTPGFKPIATFTKVKEKDKLLKICKTAIENYIYATEGGDPENAV